MTLFDLKQQFNTVLLCMSFPLNLAVNNGKTSSNCTRVITVPDLEIFLYLNNSITTNSTIHQFQGSSLLMSQPLTWQIKLDVKVLHRP